MEFEFGDRVVIHKPENVSEYPSWVSEMDEYDNRVCVVQSVDRMNHLLWVFDPEYIAEYGIPSQDSDSDMYAVGFSFSTSWCEPEEEFNEDSTALDSFLMEWRCEYGNERDI